MKTKKKKTPPKAKPASRPAKAAPPKPTRAGSASGRVRANDVRPLDDRVLVKRTDQEEVSAGGIVIPDTAREKSLRAEVVATGPGRLTKKGTRLASPLKRGDRVLIGKYVGTDVKIEGADYVIVREDDILGVLDK